MPWSVRRNSRIWFEWAIPRDLSTYRTRLCSPLPSMFFTSSHVSTSDASCWSLPCPGSTLRAVKSAVTPLAFRKSTCRVSIADTSSPLATRRKSDTGSITTTAGSNSLTDRCMPNRCASRPRMLGREHLNCRSPPSTQRLRSMPTDAMLRMISASDSSKAKYMARSPRRQLASQNCAANVDFPVPAVPLISTVLPL